MHWLLDQNNRKTIGTKIVGEGIEKPPLPFHHFTNGYWLTTIENHWTTIDYNGTLTKTIDHSIVPKI